MSRRGTPEERFWAKVDRSGDCWIWVAGRDGGGYGSLKVSGKQVIAHRFSYELHEGPIPEGMEIDHLCRNRACVNPEHLEAVTHAENVRRGKQGEYWAKKTHCPQGHPYDEANTYLYRGWRSCRACLGCKPLAK